MITPPFFSIVDTSSHSPYQSLKIESFLSWLFPFGTWPGFQCLIFKIPGWYPQRHFFFFKFLQAIGNFSAEKTMKFVFFSTVLEEESFQEVPHLNILGISSKSQRVMRWVRENIASKTYITHGRFLLFLPISVGDQLTYICLFFYQFLLSCSWVLKQ